MFILMISRGIPTPEDPQWGCFEKDQAEALVAAGHKVVVVSVDSRFRFTYRKLGTTHENINDIDYYSIFVIPGIITRYLCGLNINIRIKQKALLHLMSTVVAEHGTPDVIYSHYLPTTVAALPLKAKYGVPLVAIEHWSALNKTSLHKDVKIMGNIAYNNIDALISVSKTLQERILSHFSVNSVVVHNLVGSDFVYHEPLAHEKFNFISVGSLIYDKGFDILIKALYKLSNKAVCINIIGEGPARKKLQAMIDEYGLHDNVKLLGRMQKPQIVEVMQLSDAFAFGTRHENFSVAILEALSQGLPSIVTDCGGARDCVNENNGLIVDVDSVEQMAQAMQTMIANVKRYDRRIIANDFQKRFSSNTIIRQITEILENTVTKQQSI